MATARTATDKPCMSLFMNPFLSTSSRCAEDGRLGPSIAGPDAHRSGATLYLQRNAAVLYCTFSRRGKTNQVLRAEVLLDGCDRRRQLVGMIADEELAAGEASDFLEH